MSIFTDIFIALGSLLLTLIENCKIVKPTIKTAYNAASSNRGPYFLSERPEFTAALEQLFDSLKADPIAFSECVVAPGWRLAFTASPAVGLHYVTKGSGWVSVAGAPPKALAVGTVLITPPGHAWRIEQPGEQGVIPDNQIVEVTLPPLPLAHRVDRWTAGEGASAMELVCGHFVALDPALKGLFAGLRTAAVQPFAGESMAALMRLMLKEFAAPGLGRRAMVRALLQQLLISLLREAVATQEDWVDRVRVLHDAQVLRAFRAMVTTIEAPHSLASLADIACLSRSAFSKRFREALGGSPMAILRELRLLRAAELLRSAAQPVQRVVTDVGYTSASSFSRAFRSRFGCEPAAYAATISQRAQ